MKAKVVKIEYTDLSEGERSLYDNGVFLKKRLATEICIYGDDRISDIVSHKLSLKLTVDFGGRKHNRSAEIECPIDHEVRVVEQTQYKKRLEIYIKAVEFKKKLLELIPDIESGFYLTENELLSDVHSFLKNKYEFTHFKSEVEIDGCIADGLAFVGKSKDYRHAKIIGFEIKTNHDVFNRLYNQINSYLTICDEVYLVVESKEPPKDLPFYVGIIKVREGIPTIMRHAVSLKHSIDVGDCWKTLLKNLSTHAGIKRDSDLIGFFDAFENIKRKLIWNQFVIGFHQSYVAEYIPLSDKERNLVQAFFGAQKQLGEPEDEIDPAFRTLFDFSEK